MVILFLSMLDYVKLNRSILIQNIKPVLLYGLGSGQRTLSRRETNNRLVSPLKNTGTHSYYLAESTGASHLECLAREHNTAVGPGFELRTFG